MRRGRRFVLALGVLTVAGAAAEAVLRLGVGLGDPPLARLDPDTEYELVPSASYRRWGNSIEINAYGMRARDPSASRPDDEHRVLIIGDSVVYGTNFLDQSETMAAALQGRLLETTGCDVLALPLAASSWGPVNQRAFLEKTGTLGAEAAIIVVSAHDLYDVPLPDPDILPYRLAKPWGAIGDAIEIVGERWRAADLYQNMDPPDVRAERSLQALERMVGRLEDDGIAPVLAYHPTKSERQAGAAAERDRFRLWAEERGLRFIDLNDTIEATDGYRDDIHPDSVGVARMADVFADTLRPDLPACAG